MVTVMGSVVWGIMVYGIRGVMGRRALVDAGAIGVVIHLVRLTDVGDRKTGVIRTRGGGNGGGPDVVFIMGGDADILVMNGSAASAGMTDVLLRASDCVGTSGISFRSNVYLAVRRLLVVVVVVIVV